MLKTLDLFAGIGGIRIGFEKAGFTTVFANDFDKFCKITYDNYFKDVPLTVEDIKKVKKWDLPEFNFVLGGFPCQAFSVAGHQQGFNDEKGRGNLFLDIAEIIDKYKPEGFMLENVKNLKSHDNKNTYRIIKQTLEDLGYIVDERVLNSMEFGNVPQTRERIYIVGFREDTGIMANFKWPSKVELTKNIKSLLDDNVDKKYYYNGKPLFEKLDGNIVKKDTVYQWRRKYVRENKSKVCPTLTANMGMGGHNVPIINDGKGIRKLTPYECLRFQGFPPDYRLATNIADSRLYKQIGNSVTVTVIEAVAKEIKNAVDNTNKISISIKTANIKNNSRQLATVNN